MPGWRGEHRGIGTGQHGYSQSPRDDRGMGVGAAGDRYRAGQPGVGEADQVGRVHLAPDENEAAGLGWRGIAVGQVGEDSAGDLAYVVGAGGQVRVGQCGDRRGLRGGRALDRGRRIGTVTCRRHGRVHQGRVGRDQCADGDDVRLLGAPAFP